MKKVKRPSVKKLIVTYCENRGILMFDGEKTNLFWVGLIILGFGTLALLTAIWLTIVSFFSYLSYSLPSPFSYYFIGSYAPIVAGGIIFMLIGWYMMKSGVKKELASHTRSKSGLKLVGYSLIILGTVLLIAGFIAPFYPVLGSTPDPPIIREIIYPYERYSAGLLVAGFVSLFIGLVLIYVSRRSKNDPQLINK